jgi:predicted MPP superfamily phosphohydrolase
MFRFILLSIITLMHLYVFWRVCTVPFITNHIPRTLLAGLGLVLWLGLYLGLLYGHRHSGTLAMLFEVFGMHWMAVLFLLFVCLLPVDIITVFGFILRRWAPALRGLALITGLALSAFALFQGLRPPVIKEYDILIPELPDHLHGTVIVAVSDLHLGSLVGENWLEKRVTQVQDQHPDLVVLLGDIFEGHGGASDDFTSILHRLSAPLGVWGVLGNHEFYGNESRSTSLMNHAGINVLRNTAVLIGQDLILAGVDDMTFRRWSREKPDYIREALTNRPPGATILLSHSPLQAEQAAENSVQLMLSGHTHGGQIWPFSYLVRRWYPRFAGIYTVDGMPLIVSRGTGTWGPRMRLWHPGEILRITLLKRSGN